MNNQRSISQKSLITIRKWLLEAGDGPSTSVCIPSARFDHSRSDKIVKRKRFNNQKYYSKTTSMINWFYEFIKNVFTFYDENQLRYDNMSMMTCSTCQLENIDSNIKNIQLTLKSSKSNSVLHSKINPKIMITTATSSSNLTISKSIQTQVYLKDKPLAPSSHQSEYADLPVDLTHSSYHPTIASIISSNSNINSLQTTDIHRPSSSLHDTRICRFDKRNCLIECYHSSTSEKKSRSNSTHAAEIVFAESTCQLIKQAWLSSTSDQQLKS